MLCVGAPAGTAAWPLFRPPARQATPSLLSCSEECPVPADCSPETARQQSSWKLRARWLWDGCQPAGEDVVLEIIDGQIAGLASAGASAAMNLGNVAILPGLINAHTHLEFSDLPHPLRTSLPFTRWAADLIQVRRHRTAGSAGSVLQGLRESAAAGTTLLGEITTDDSAVPADSSTEPGVVSFREIIGLDPARAPAHVETAVAHLSGGSAAISSDSEGPLPACRHRGISPHAPYSVHRELLSQLVQLASSRQVPLAMHLAETRSELQLLRDGTGEFQRMLAALGVWLEGLFPAAGLGTPLKYLELLAEAPSALIIHGNYLGDEELRVLADCPQLTLVYCPRTHAYFRHAAHPWQQLLALGGRVVLGTDGRGSTPDLSIWRELCFLARRHPACSSSQLLPLATTCPPGMNSAGRAIETSTPAPALQPGAPADLTIIRLPPGSGFDFERDLLRSRSLVCGTMRAGQWLLRPEEAHGRK